MEKMEIPRPKLRLNLAEEKKAKTQSQGQQVHHRSLPCWSPNRKPAAKRYFRMIFVYLLSTTLTIIASDPLILAFLLLFSIGLPGNMPTLEDGVLAFLAEKKIFYFVLVSSWVILPL
jgi:hypothetical protein